MSELDIAIRSMLHRYWEQGYTATGAARKICEVKGNKALSIRAAQVWFKKFSCGNINLESKPRSGRPRSAVDLIAVMEAAEIDPNTSTRKLSAELGVSQSTVARRLKDAGMVSKSCRSVPHKLTSKQAAHRLEVQVNPSDLTFIKRVVTCDKKLKNFDKMNTPTMNSYIPTTPSSPQTD